MKKVIFDVDGVLLVRNDILMCPLLRFGNGCTVRIIWGLPTIQDCRFMEMMHGLPLCGTGYGQEIRCCRG